MDKLETRMENMESKMDHLTTEMRSNFKYSTTKWTSIGGYLKLSQER